MKRTKTSTLDIRSACDKYIYALKMASRLYGKINVLDQKVIDSSANDVHAFLKVNTHNLEMLIKRGESCSVK